MKAKALSEKCEKTCFWKLWLERNARSSKAILLFQILGNFWNSMHLFGVQIILKLHPLLVTKYWWEEVLLWAPLVFVGWRMYHFLSLYFPFWLQKVSFLPKKEKETNEFRSSFGFRVERMYHFLSLYHPFWLQEVRFLPMKEKETNEKGTYFQLYTRCGIISIPVLGSTMDKKHSSMMVRATTNLELHSAIIAKRGVDRIFWSLWMHLRSIHENPFANWLINPSRDWRAV